MLKKYFHIGIAIDTPRGLVVGVVRDCDAQGRGAASPPTSPRSTRRRAAAACRCRDGRRLHVDQLAGRHRRHGFTPIVNAPEVAILGITKAQWKPRRGADDAVEWRLKTPLSLSYDHRVINGADAARFLRHLDEVLARPAALL